MEEWHNLEEIQEGCIEQGRVVSFAQIEYICSLSQREIVQVPNTLFTTKYITLHIEEEGKKLYK